MCFCRVTWRTTLSMRLSVCISALSRGILIKKHGNADPSNTGLLFRTIHSAIQLSIYGAVSSWCAEFGQRPNEKVPSSERFVAQEVNSLVQTPRNDDPASGIRLRECLQRFETLEKKSNLQKFVKMRHSGEQSIKTTSKDPFSQCE